MTACIKVHSWQGVHTVKGGRMKWSDIDVYPNIVSFVEYYFDGEHGEWTALYGVQTPDGEQATYFTNEEI